MYYDIFNGDADGIFALHQYRLENPQPMTQLITGVKRDIQLLFQLENQRNSQLTVFDISLDSNRPALLHLLQQQNTIVYFDHHFAGSIPESPLLQACIDPSPDTCTAMLVNKTLAGKYCLWAICGAFGDNLHRLANQQAKSQGLTEYQTGQLQELGELFNYNGYGTTIGDLHYHPRDLYTAIHPYTNPFTFLEHSPEIEVLRRGYKEDITLAMQVQELKTVDKNRVYILPDTPWARRVTGVFSNLRMREQPDAAHAIITEDKNNNLRVSVRAPLNDRRDADTLCNLFPTGGGRKAAAGINSLPAHQLDDFIEKFLSFYR